MDEKSALDEILGWCSTVLGRYEILSDTSREHAGRRASSLRLRTESGVCYVKMHRDPGHWASEVHGYEQWAPAFGQYAPRLLAVRDQEPLALIISELPGEMMEALPLTPAQERAAWRSAGQALAGLHRLDPGEYFGPCRRDGSPAGEPVSDAQVYIAQCFDDLEQRDERGNFLTGNERAIARSIRSLMPSFKGEHPLPCHRDYCPANWLSTRSGIWTGVIDFEFSYWDTRTADFSRLPNWQWVSRPDLMGAFREGYGRVFTSQEEQQLLMSEAQYALVGIVWGKENDYNGFAAEGRKALAYLGSLL